MRPRINPACINSKHHVYSPELYTIQGNPSIFFYRREEAIKKTAKVASEKDTVIVILLNGNRFVKVKQDGSCTWVYNPEMDFVTAPKLKQFFIQRGFVHQAFLVN
jgi:hypothetical protein